MAEMRIDAAMFRKMVVSAANYLEHNKQLLNDLNVFPVPDGDTGTNMFLTIVSAVKEVSAVQSEKVGALTKAMGNGALKGARGNSGVILSQLFRGFAQSVPVEQEVLSAADFARAIQLLLEHQIQNEIVNVASQTATSLTEILDEVQEKTGQVIEIRHVNSEVPVVDQIVLNIEKLKRLTGFTIQTTIQEGIAKEIKRIKKEQGGIRK